MELHLNRDIRTPKSTTSALTVNGVPECFILEDYDRGLKQSMPLDQIKQLKVPGKTAIPSGRYKVIINMSNRFGIELPLLLDVPGFEGVRIHPGNTAENTEGCLLPGVTRTKDFVSSSRVAFNKLFEKMKEAKRLKQDIFITIT
jgi:hypothetical protein